MTRNKVQTHIHSIENRIQRKEQEISRDEAAIIKCDSNMMTVECSLSLAKTVSMEKAYQRRIESSKKEKMRHQELKNRHQQDLNRLKRDLLSAQRQLGKNPSEKNDTNIILQPINHMEQIYQIFVSSIY